MSERSQSNGDAAPGEPKFVKDARFRATVATRSLQDSIQTFETFTREARIKGEHEETILDIEEKTLQTIVAKCEAARLKIKNRLKELKSAPAPAPEKIDHTIILGQVLSEIPENIRKQLEPRRHYKEIKAGEKVREELREWAKYIWIRLMRFPEARILFRETYHFSESQLQDWIPPKKMDILPIENSNA